MVTLCHAYESKYDAETAIERLLASGVRETAIRLITGDAVKDSRDLPIGTFAGTTTAEAVIVGSYADIAHSGREATGSFSGDPGKRRRGSFGDADRDTVTTYRAGEPRSRIVSHRKLKRILREAGLDEATATANVGALHDGRVLVLVASESPPDDIAAALAEVAPSRVPAAL